MREPTISKLYPPDIPGRSSHCYVRWYVNGKRQTKKFTDPTRAQLFHQEKLAEHAGHPFNAGMMALQKVSVIERAIMDFASKDDARMLDLEAENTRLSEEIAKFIQKARGRASEDPQPRTPKQSINIHALQWAYAQEDLSVTAKAVLVTFAKHANQEGYTWPGVDRIAFIWGMDRDTVRRQISALLVRRLLRPTKKRCGSTGRVKVYRLPKNTYEIGGKCPLFENDKNQTKGGDNRRTIGGESAPNNEIMNNQQQHHHHDELITLDNSILATPSNASTSSSFFVEGHQKHQSHSARDHVKWPEYATYCGSQNGKKAKDGRVHDGIPTEKGFWKWMRGQKPQWRNKRKQPDYIDGFVLDGKFHTPEEANRIGADNPRLLDEGRFHPARKGHDGKIVIISEPKR
jgi:hypothetical protein